MVSPRKAGLRKKVVDPVVVASKKLVDNPELGRQVLASVTISDNRSSIIGDALRSVVDLVDLVVLLDTGITDDTVEVARSVAGNKLRVGKHVWRDFGTARNASLDYARSLGADWAIVTDTDERYYWRGVDVRAALKTATSDILWMPDADGTYVKEKILRLGKTVQYRGPTHEVPVGGAYAAFSGTAAVFDELGKTHEQLFLKYQRDAKVLTEWITQSQENANDGRWFYYLGDAYQGLNNLEAAIIAFGRCVELRRPVSEEGAWAAYRQAQCFSILNRHIEALEVLARGFTRHSGIAELAWAAAVSCHRLGWLEQATCWARTSIALGRYAGHAPTRLLFTHLPALYELPYDVLRYTLPTEEERQQAAHTFTLAKRARLGAMDERGVDVGSVTPGSHRHELRTMLRPSPLRKMLATTKVIDLEPSVESLKAGGIERYHAMNPSVCVHEGELYVLVRMVNYTIEHGAYVVPDADGKVRTENLLGKFVVHDSGVQFSNLGLVQDLAGGQRTATRVLGYEDMRIFSVNGKLWASATVRDRGEDRCKMVLLELDRDGDVSSAEVLATARWTEKNWMPIEGAHRWLYEVCPTVVRTRRGSTESRPCSLALEHLRGGSQVVPFQDGWLCCTHETIAQDGWGCRRIYLHRFVRFDASFDVKAVSPAWTFEDGHHGIEFCAGLSRNPQKKGQMILGYGVEDRQAKLLLVDEKEIEGMDWMVAP